MAVESKFAITEQETGYPKPGYKIEGQALKAIVSKVAIAAADDNGSVYGVALVSGKACIKDIKVANTTGMTGSNDWDIGLYRLALTAPAKTVGVIGTVIDKDIFADGIDLSSVHARGSELSGMLTLSMANSDKTVAELVNGVSGVTENDALYVVALTANAVGSVAGTAIVLIDVIENN